MEGYIMNNFDDEVRPMAIFDRSVEVLIMQRIFKLRDKLSGYLLCILL